MKSRRETGLEDILIYDGNVFLEIRIILRDETEPFPDHCSSHPFLFWMNADLQSNK